MEADKNTSLEIKKPTELGFFNTKSQKLATALYLITGFFSDNEPMKWKLRDLASKLISASLGIKDMSADANKDVVNLRSLVTEITSFLTVLKQAGLISEMNFSILNQEFSALGGRLSQSGEFDEIGNRGIQKDFFVVEDTTEETPHRLSPQPIKDNSIESKPAPTRELLDFRPHRPIETRGEAKVLKDFSVVAVKKNSRQSIIINLLKRKKEIMIKDVSPLIDGCSEKTIQRELLSMVQNGILNKTGEKRWSRYSLAK